MANVVLNSQISYYQKHAIHLTLFGMLHAREGPTLTYKKLMKTIPLTRFAFIAAFGAVAPAYSQETGETTAEVVPAPGSLATSIRDGATFSILASAIKAAELEEELGGNNRYTVFAPTDEAFAKLPAGFLDKLLLPENKEKLRSLVLFHVIPGEFPTINLKDGDLKTANGDKVEIDVDGDKIEIEDADVVNADQLASNGVIHVIDEVLVPKAIKKDLAK